MALRNKNKYAIQLIFPEAFEEFNFRLTKWRQISDSLYNLAKTLKARHTVTINQSDATATNVNPNLIENYTREYAIYQEYEKATILTLNEVGNFYEKFSSFDVVYQTLPQTNPSEPYVSASNPLNVAAGENIRLDIDNIHKGMIQILKSYGQYDNVDKLWIMNSRIAAFNAYNLILSEYPVLPQILYRYSYPYVTVGGTKYYTPKLPVEITENTLFKTKKVFIEDPNDSTVGTIVEEQVLNDSILSSNPIFKSVYDSGLNELLNERSKRFDKPLSEFPILNAGNETGVGTFKIVYSNANGIIDDIIDDVANIKNSQIDVTIYNDNGLIQS